MSNQKNNPFANEQLTPEIARKGIYELGKVDRIPPAVGIFDSPTRCFVVNIEWWAHIAGMVHLLADVVSWKDATDEDYFAIKEILRFMQGMECMDFALRQKPDDTCILQQTLDGGTTWTDVFDFSLCATIQDKSYQVQIQNQVTYVQPTFQEIYNNYVSNYAGNPESVYPNLAEPTGDTSALRAAYCNALWELVNSACNAAISYYNEFPDDLQNQVNVGLAIAGFILAVISVAGAIPTAGASLYGLAGAATLWAAAIGLSGVIGNQLVDFWQSHTIDQFQDESAKEDVVCYLFEGVAAVDNSLAAMRAALDTHPLTGNAGVIADFLSIMFQHDSTYAAFLEKWSNNKEFADAGIELYCPCATGYKVWAWHFSNGLGDFFIQQGTLNGGRVKGIDVGTSKRAIVVMPFDPSWRVVSAEITVTRENGTLHGSLDTENIYLRPTANSDAGKINIVANGFEPNGLWTRCTSASPTYYPAGNQIVFLANVTDNPSSNIYIESVRIQFVEGFAKGGYITDDPNICV